MSNFLNAVGFYTSTRGKLNTVNSKRLEETLFSGFLSDNGIFIPERIQPLDTWKDWKNFTYPEIVGKLLRLFSDEEEMSLVDINGITSRAFQRFQHSDVVPLHQIEKTTYVAELFQGPTLSFKDLALSIIGQLLEFFLAKKQKHVIVLVGTSGDTGSAAIECVRGSKWVDIVVLYSKGRCTLLQELQMTTVLDDNIHVLAVDGTSDELDKPIRSCFADADFVARYNLCSINSINWVRILVQVAHYFYIYLKLVPDGDETVEFILPTGACGNLTSGIIAKCLGLPIKLIAAVNANCVLHKALTEGVLEEGRTVHTLASAMDIQVPYNFERMLYLSNGGNHCQVKQLMEELESEKSLKIPPEILKELRNTFSTCVVSDKEICSTMKRCWDEHKYLIDPHTAVAMTFHYQHSSSQKRVCLATASPEKFPEAVEKSGIEEKQSRLTHLHSLQKRFQHLDTGSWEVQLRQKIRDIYDLRQ